MKAQDPVAWMAPNGIVNPFKTGPFNQPLYPCPQKREWVGLTDEEREAAIDAVPAANLGGEYYDKELTAIALAIESKLKEKNHG